MPAAAAEHRSEDRSGGLPGPRGHRPAEAACPATRARAASRRAISPAPPRTPATDLRNIAKGSEVCFCEIQQFGDKTPEDPDDLDDLKACQTDLTEPVNSDVTDGDLSGWCYIDGEAGIGDEELVSKCPDTEKRIIRFTGEAEAQAGATLFITCSGEQQ